MDAQQLKELKSLQEENRRLNQMYADLSLDHGILEDIIEKKAEALLAQRAGRGHRKRGRPVHSASLRRRMPLSFDVVLPEPS